MKFPTNKAEGIIFASNPSNRTMISIPILLVASFVFYALSGFFNYVSGGSTVEETIMSGITDSNAGDTFQKIQVAMRVMPSHKTEGNMLLMVADNGVAEHADEYVSDFADSITPDFFTTDNMEEYFPEMQFNANTVPLGNAKPFCMHLDWALKANRKILDKYYSIQDFPTCKLAQNKKFRWQDNDPRDGLDFNLWKQYSKKGASADDCESNAIFVKSKTQGGGTCFRYEILESVCVAVEFKVNEESATYGWTYAGGCFEDGRIANYMDAKPNTDYNFDKLDFEVREYNASIAEKLGSVFSLTGLFGLLAALCLLGAIVAGCIFVYQLVQDKKKMSAAAGTVEMADIKGKDKHYPLRDEQ